MVVHGLPGEYRPWRIICFRLSTTGRMAALIADMTGQPFTAQMSAKLTKPTLTVTGNSAQSDGMTMLTIISSMSYYPLP